MICIKCHPQALSKIDSFFEENETVFELVGHSKASGVSIVVAQLSYRRVGSAAAAAAAAAFAN